MLLRVYVGSRYDNVVQRHRLTCGRNEMMKMSLVGPTLIFFFGRAAVPEAHNELRCPIGGHCCKILKGEVYQFSRSQWRPNSVLNSRLVVLSCTFCMPVHRSNATAHDYQQACFTPQDTRTVSWSPSSLSFFFFSPSLCWRQKRVAYCLLF